MHMFDRVSSRRWNRMVDHLLGFVHRYGLHEFIEKCSQSLPATLHQTAFANACDIVLTHGHIQNSDFEFLNLLQKSLQIDRKTALTIIDVLITKNKG